MSDSAAAAAAAAAAATARARAASADGHWRAGGAADRRVVDDQ